VQGTPSRPATTSAPSGDESSSAKRYYRIGEVSRITGVKPHVLRYWETEFRWMAPPKSRSKQRLYRRKDIETVLAIKRLLYEERYTIAGARLQLRESGLTQILEDGGVATDASRRPDPDPAQPGHELSRVREGLGRLRRELQAIRGLLR
jgi:DNA-binding transcriptional MerR regulator